MECRVLSIPIVIAIPFPRINKILLEVPTLEEAFGIPWNWRLKWYAKKKNWLNSIELSEYYLARNRLQNIGRTISILW